MEEQRFDAGNVAFVVKELHTRRGHGVSVDIRARQSAEDVSVVRLDWFPECPHYHYNAGKEHGKEIPLDPALIGDTVDWFLERIPDRLPSMIDSAGFPDIAKAMSSREVTGVMPHVKRVAKTLCERVTRETA